MFANWLATWLCLAVYCAAVPVAKRTLLVVDPTQKRLDVDALTSQLQGNGHLLTHKSIKDNEPLFEVGSPRYDTVILVSGKTKAMGKELAASKLLRFLEAGGNVIASTDALNAPVSVREAAAQVGISVAPRGVGLVDHFGEISVGGASAIGDFAPVTIHNSSAALVTGELAFPVLKAPKTSYSFQSRDEDQKDTLSKPFSLGDEAAVVAAAQLRNNARFLWVGSPELLSGAIGEQLISWASKERGILRLAHVEHKGPDGETHQHYRVEDKLSYVATIEQWNDGRWDPYEADDVQLEFVMLDPYYRVTLDQIAPGVFGTSFKAPDQYGVFTFSLEYSKPGWTSIKDRRAVTMRHIANDEWPRSWTITNSWVYLTSGLSVVFGFLVFVGLYFGEEKKA